MNRLLKRLDSVWGTALIAILIGAAVFLYLFTAAPLNPTNVNWMYARGGDLLQQQLGWMAYRAEPWSAQIGVIANYPDGVSTSIIYSNMTPLPAVFFKLLNPILPSTFQFTGLWVLLCWVLQVYFAIRILEEYNCSRLVRYGGAALLAFAPVLIERAFHHDPLCAQWLLLAGLWLLVRAVHGRSGFRFWPVLLTLAVWIHAYIFFILLFLFAAALWIHLRNASTRREAALVLVLAGGLCLVSAALLGMFNISPQTDLADIRNYSVNLNSFINPGKSSAFLKQLGLAFDGQYEGSAYLGLGGLLLIAAAILAWKWFPAVWSTRREYAPVLLAVLAMALLATGGALTWGKTVLFSIPLPATLTGLLSVVRSLGRFIWPLYYLGLISALVIFDRRSTARFWLLALLVIQVADLNPLRQQKSYVLESEYRSPLVSQFWQDIPTAYRHIVFLPDEKIEEDSQPFAIYALRRGITINWTYLARGDYETMNRSMQSALEELRAGQTQPETIYISWDESQVSEITQSAGDALFVCREKDHWLILDSSSVTADLRAGLDRCQ